MVKHKTYPVSRADFKYFVQECKYCISFLGTHDAPVTFAHEVPPNSENTLAGSIQYEDSQKLLIFLAKEWPREVTKKKLKYLAIHECVEIELTKKFLAFAEECAKTGRVDYGRWDHIVHSVMNRIINLIDPVVMSDIAEEDVFEKEVADGLGL